MTGYEIVKRNITFNKAPRVALKFPSFNCGDITRLFTQRPRNCRHVGEIGIMTKKAVPYDGEYDEWGIKWESKGGGLGLGQPVDYPIHKIEELIDYNWPDPYAVGRFDGLEEALLEAEKTQKWVQLNSQYCMFERHHLLRSYEEALIDLYTEPEITEKICDKALEYQLGILRQSHKLSNGRIHCFETSDDWGTQNALQINPNMWKKIYKPRYKKLIDEVHSYGMFFELHSCGRLNDIMDDLVELKIDMLNIHQPNLMDIKTFGKKYAGKIAFDVAVDIQKTLPTNNKEIIEQEVKDLISYWGTDQGGIIGAEYRFLDAIGTTKESMEFSCDCFKKYGKLRG